MVLYRGIQLYYKMRFQPVLCTLYHCTTDPLRSCVFRNMTTSLRNIVSPSDSARGHRPQIGYRHTQRNEPTNWWWLYGLCGESGTPPPHPEPPQLGLESPPACVSDASRGPVGQKQLHSSVASPSWGKTSELATQSVWFLTPSGDSGSLHADGITSSMSQWATKDFPPIRNNKHWWILTCFTLEIRYGFFSADIHTDNW